ncbi:inosine triphosphate pyrophosphatase-like protein [Globomyces pollinis-pini]|nr:inosine triphosphate pyrophosphatase-like protein [Globomyces pollinis-pini]
MLPIILGSSSKFRSAVLRDAGYEFTNLSPDVDEKNIGLESRNIQDAKNLTLIIAKAKSKALLESKLIIVDSILITADQVVVYNGKVREKPIDKDECRRYLQSYAIAPAETYSSLVVTNTKTGQQAQGVDIAKQFFHEIPNDIIDALIAKGDVMHSCGGFVVEDELLIPYLGEREGDEDSIRGMPLKLLSNLIEQVQ